VAIDAAPGPEPLSARAVFGTPVSGHGRTVMPMAEVRTAFGCRGRGGGGGRWSAIPVGAIELNDDGVHVHASPAVTARVVIAALLLIGWNVFWIARALRRNDGGTGRTGSPRGHGDRPEDHRG
jgi:hypothetical protein